MFDHVTVRVSDRRATAPLYEAVLGTLGIRPTHVGGHFTEWDDFSVSQAREDRPLTRGLHIGFVAPSREHVHEFWRVATAAGLRDDGAPGPRPQYRDDYYGSFVLDPDGNSIEAVHHGAMREGGWIDHLWIRVADIAASRRFYETIAPHAGFRLRRDLPDRTQFAGNTGSFSVVRGSPAQNVHLAFPAADEEAVDEFHRVATAAGYADNGPPGERPQYHPGYYGAFVLDPDGNNVEAVHHDRS